MNWSALASFANVRWKTSLSDRDLRRVGRDAAAEFLQEQVRDAIHRVDLSDGARYLAHDFGLRSACGWTEWRFGEPLDAAELEQVERNGLDPQAFKQLVARKAREVYARREIEYPARERFDPALDEAAVASSDLDTLRTTLVAASRRRHARDDDPRDEMKRMERAVLLQILDNSWKDHLLAMDHLRSSVGLRGYAQVDPKVEFKREGMRTFDLMWKGIDERVTDIVYRIEQVEDDALRSTWRETAAIHAEAPSVSASEQPQSAEGAAPRPDLQSAVEPIRNLGQKVGRNDPCPCGSGKKFKNCCGKSSGVAAG